MLNCLIEYHRRTAYLNWTTSKSGQFYHTEPYFNLSRNRQCGIANPFAQLNSISGHSSKCGSQHSYLITSTNFEYCVELAKATSQVAHLKYQNTGLLKVPKYWI